MQFWWYQTKYISHENVHLWPSFTHTIVSLHPTFPPWSCWVSVLRWVCSFPVTRRLGYLWAAVSQAAPPIREEQARGHHLFIQPGPNDVWAECAQFEARCPSSILLKRVSQGSHWKWAPAGSGPGFCLRYLDLYVRPEDTTASLTDTLSWCGASCDGLQSVNHCTQGFVCCCGLFRHVI